MLNKGVDLQLVPDAILPIQWDWRSRNRHGISGERRLLLAVLEAAFSDLTQWPVDSERWRDGMRWVQSPRQHLYSFSAVCEYLGLDESAMRSLLVHHARQPRRRKVYREKAR